MNVLSDIEDILPLGTSLKRVSEGLGMIIKYRRGHTLRSIISLRGSSLTRRMKLTVTESKGFIII